MKQILLVFVQAHQQLNMQHETFFIIYFSGFAECYFLSVFQLMINFCGRIFELNLKGFCRSLKYKPLSSLGCVALLNKLIEPTSWDITGQNVKQMHYNYSKTQKKKMASLEKRFLFLSDFSGFWGFSQNKIEIVIKTCSMQVLFSLFSCLRWGIFNLLEGEFES